jgi:hypothetical protein
MIVVYSGLFIYYDDILVQAIPSWPHGYIFLVNWITDDGHILHIRTLYFLRRNEKRLLVVP